MEGYCDEELLYLMRCGSERAACCLYERYKKYMNGWVNKYTMKLDVVHGWEDLIQTGMIFLDFAFENYRDDQGTSLKTYAGVVVGNRLMTHMRRVIVKRKVFDIDSVSFDQYLGDDKHMRYDEIVEDPKKMYQPQSWMLVKEDAYQYKTYIEDTLSLREKEVITYIQLGYNQEEISRKLNISLKSVYNTIYRYRQKMKHYVK